MALAFHKEALCDGVNFTAVTDTRFKTNLIGINLVSDLDAKTAAANAAISLVLSKSNSTYKNITEINKKLSSLYGANINGDTLKIGDSQIISLTASCIADRYTFGGEKITGELVDLLIECLFSPNVEDGGFYAKNFELNKQELLDEIDAEINEKRSYALIRAGKKVYEGEPASITAHGDKEYALELTPKSAYEQYKNVLKTAGIEIFFVGGGDPADALERFKKAFAGAERNFSGKSVSKKSPLKTQACEVTETLDVAQSKMVMAFKSGFENAPAMRLMNAIFGQTPFSKLFMNVREKLSLCYYCAAGYDERKGVLVVDSGVEHKNIQKARDEILNQLSEVANGNFTDSEMSNSALSVINNYRAVNDSAFALASWYLRQAYAGTSFTPEQEIERIKAVSREDIVNAAKSLSLDTVYVLTGKGGK